MSGILESWISGEGLPDALVIDGHVHVGEWPHSTTFDSADEAVEKSVALMDANGIDAVVAVGGGYMFPATDYTVGNDFLLEVSGRLPDRIIPFMSVNPNDTKDRIIAELDRTYGAGIRGIKLINAYQENYPGDGPNLMAVYEYASKHNMIVFNHHWEVGVIMDVSARFPETVFIFGHYSTPCDAVMAERENVYANIWSYDSLGWIDRGVRTLGAAKFMAGSDGFMNPMSCGIGPVVFADIPDDDKRLILGINVARLLDRVGALPAPLKAKLSAA
ncbi:amidohydrolase family protein [Planctomycetota bacterium]